MEGDLQGTLGANLRRFRETQGLSQEAFADLIGIHRTYMGALERGERNITLQTLERLAERIGAKALDLLTPEVKSSARRNRRAESDSPR